MKTFFFLGQLSLGKVRLKPDIEPGVAWMSYMFNGDTTWSHLIKATWSCDIVEEEGRHMQEAVKAALVVKHGATGLEMSGWNMCASHAISEGQSSTGHVSGQQWLARVIAAGLHIGRQVDERRFEIAATLKSVHDLLLPFAEYKITSFADHRHWFPNMAPASRMLRLDAANIGLCHAFAMLRAQSDSDDVYLMVEKYADGLEVCLSKSRYLHLYGRFFRAAGETRPVSDSRPITAEDTVDLCCTDWAIRTLRDLEEWLTGPLAMVFQQYSLLFRNCQHFIFNLTEFLQGQLSMEAVREALGAERAAVLLAVQADEVLCDMPAKLCEVIQKSSSMLFAMIIPYWFTQASRCTEMETCSSVCSSRVAAPPR